VNPYRAFGQFGYERDAASRLYVRARHLRPDQGRWLSRDPVETEPRYLYVANQPTAKTDPSGWTRSMQMTKDYAWLILTSCGDIDNIYDEVLAVGEVFLEKSADKLGNYLAIAERRVPGLEDALGGMAFPTPLGPLTIAGWKDLKNKYPDGIGRYLPPQPGSPDYVRWDAGFVWGVVSVIAPLAKLVAPATPIKTLREAIRYAADFPGVRQAMCDLYAVLYRSLTSGFTDPWPELGDSRHPFKQGKAQGIFLTNVVMTIVAVLKAVNGLSKLATLWPEMLKEFGGSMAESPKTLIPKMIEFAQRRIGGTAKTSAAKHAKQEAIRAKGNLDAETNKHMAAGGTAHAGKPKRPPTKPPLDVHPYARDHSSRVLSPGVKAAEYVYVQDADGVVHIATNGGHMHPRVLGGAAPAAGAGTLIVDAEGVVTEVTNFSGTFRFGPDTLPQVVEAIRQQGLKVAPTAPKAYNW
jgi:RHS repeat-associated protein